MISNSPQPFCAPVLAVSGFSGSGKTTLLEAGIPQLVKSGLSVAVVKHDAHGVQIDHVGKDSDRLFQAGATVALRGPDQQFLRRRDSSALSLHATLDLLSRDHDLLLVEGHKNTPLPKLWLQDEQGNEIPADVTNVLGTLKWNANRVEEFVGFVEGWLPAAWQIRPLCLGLLAGGENSDALSTERFRELAGAVLDVSTFALLGGNVATTIDGVVHLPDAPEMTGPCAGLVAAHRWAPTAAWVIAPWNRCEFTDSWFKWLISLRQPGQWALIPRQEDGIPCPLAGLYEPQALTALARQASENPESARIAVLVNHPKTLLTRPPAESKK